MKFDNETLEKLATNTWVGYFNKKKKVDQKEFYSMVQNLCVSYAQHLKFNSKQCELLQEVLDNKFNLIFTKIQDEINDKNVKNNTNLLFRFTSDLMDEYNFAQETEIKRLLDIYYQQAYEIYCRNEEEAAEEKLKLQKFKLECDEKIADLVDTLDDIEIELA